MMGCPGLLAQPNSSRLPSSRDPQASLRLGFASIIDPIAAGSFASMSEDLAFLSASPVAAMCASCTATSCSDSFWAAWREPSARVTSASASAAAEIYSASASPCAWIVAALAAPIAAVSSCCASAAATAPFARLCISCGSAGFAEMMLMDRTSTP
jgi:hypothetical protein